MKTKILSLVLGIVLCLPLFVACESYSHKDIYTKFDEFFSNTQNNIVWTGEIDYPEKIDDKIAVDDKYGILNTYSAILTAETKIVKNFYGSFAVTPLKEKNMKSKYAKTLESLEELATQIVEFNDFTSYYFDTITDLSLSNNVIADSNLQDFKKEYAELISKANEVNKNFIEIYIAVYGNFNLESAQTVADVDLTSAVLFAYADFMDTYIKYALDEFEGVHGELTNFYNDLSYLFNNITFDNFNQDAFGEWLEVFKLYNTDKEIFFDALDEIDVDGVNKENQLNEIYIGKIERFVGVNASLAITKTSALLGLQ